MMVCHEGNDMIDEHDANDMVDEHDGNDMIGTT